MCGDVKVCGAVWVVYGVLGQLGRAVKAIDSKSIGATRVSSSLTAVDVFKSTSCLLLSVGCCLAFGHFVILIVLKAGYW